MGKISTRGLLITAWLVSIVTALLFIPALFKGPEPSAAVLSGMRAVMTLLWILYGFRRRSLSVWIFISMLAGIQIGFDFPKVATSLHVLSEVFLRLIKTIVSPLLFATLVYGIAGHSNIRQVGRMGLKSLIYFEIVTTLALLIGLVCIRLSKAGQGIQAPGQLHENVSLAASPRLEELILHIFPENLARSVADGQILQVVVFSILFGIGLSLCKPDIRKPMLDFCHSLSEVMFKFTGIVMYLAPLAVASAIAYTVSTMGLGILAHLFALLGTLYVALILFLMLILLPILLWSKVSVLNFIKAIAEPVSIAFATSSSEAALPKAMQAMEEFGVPGKIVSFVMPAGYSFNQDGSTLYLTVATVFIAQAAGKTFSFGEELLIVLALSLSSKGVAGVPRAPFAILAGMAVSFGLPSWPIFILFGIDSLMDMARTAVNVIGNCLATVVIAKSEKEFDQQKSINFAGKQAI